MYYKHLAGRLTCLLACLLPALIIMTAGCGGPAMAPVTGKVMVGGLPVVRGSVYFVPNKSKGTSGKAAVGDIGPDGTYILKTPGRGDGAVVGHYLISLSGRATGDEEHVPPNRQIPTRFISARHSALSAEVKPGPNTIDFTLR